MICCLACVPGETDGIQGDWSMHRWLAACLLLVVPQLRAGEPRGKTVLDLWDAAHLQGSKTGYVNTNVVEFKQDGQTLYRTTIVLNLTVKRNNDIIQLRMDTGDTETAEGKVVGVFMRQYVGKNKALDLTGTVVGKELRLMVDNRPIKRAPWNDQVVGLYRQQTLFKDRKVKPGDSLNYLSFESSINLVVNTQVQVKDYEEIELFGGQLRKKLL